MTHSSSVATAGVQPAAMKSIGRTILYGFLILLAFLQLFPLLWVFDYSILKSGDLFGPELLKIPVHPQWGNYIRAWVDGKIPRYFLNSAIVVVSSVAASTLISRTPRGMCTAPGRSP